MSEMKLHLEPGNVEMCDLSEESHTSRGWSGWVCINVRIMSSPNWRNFKRNLLHNHLTHQ